MLKNRQKGAFEIWQIEAVVEQQREAELVVFDPSNSVDTQDEVHDAHKALEMWCETFLQRNRKEFSHRYSSCNFSEYGTW